MKQKKFAKKLDLNKRTLVTLNNPTMDNIQAGGIVPFSEPVMSFCMGCPTVLSCDTCADSCPYTCNETFKTCDPLMCGSDLPYQC